MVATATAHHILYYIWGSLSLVYYQGQDDHLETSAVGLSAHTTRYSSFPR